MSENNTAPVLPGASDDPKLVAPYHDGRLLSIVASLEEPSDQRDVVFDLLRSEYFTDPAHAAIFAALREAHRKDEVFTDQSIKLRLDPELSDQWFDIWVGRNRVKSDAVKEIKAFASKSAKELAAEEINRIGLELIANPQADIGHRLDHARDLLDAHNPTPWEPPIPFEVFDLPAFPVKALPLWLHEMAEAVAEAYQVPPDLPALLGLAAVAIAVAKKCNIQPRPGHIEQLALFILIALLSGVRKTPVFSKIMKPIYAAEERMIREAKPRIAATLNQYQIAENRLKGLNTKAARVDDPIQRRIYESEASQAAVELSAMELPASPRLLLDDVTPESLVLHLHHQGGRIAVASAEGGGLIGLAGGRYSQDGRAFYDGLLKGYSGDHLCQDRIGRESVVVQNPCVNLALTVQPSILSELSDISGVETRGLLSRFLFSIPADFVGRRQISPPPVPDYVIQEYADHLDRLLDSPVPNEPALIVYSRAALTCLENFERALEPRLGQDGDLFGVRPWASKLCGLIVRISGVIHLAEGGAGEIGADVVRRAIQIGEYGLSHALAAYGVMRAIPELEDAKVLLHWIKGREGPTFSRHDVMVSNGRRFDSAEKTDSTIKQLEDRGYVRRLQVKRTTPLSSGRPPAPTFEINPILKHRKASDETYKIPGSVCSVGQIPAYSDPEAPMEVEA